MSFICNEDNQICPSQLPSSLRAFRLFFFSSSLLSSSRCLSFDFLLLAGFVFTWKTMSSIRVEIFLKDFFLFPFVIRNMNPFSGFLSEYPKILSFFLTNFIGLEVTLTEWNYEYECFDPHFHYYIREKRFFLPQITVGHSAFKSSTGYRCLFNFRIRIQISGDSVLTGHWHS